MEGVVVRDQLGCASRSGGLCACRPSFQAQVWSTRDRKTIRRTFRTVAEAKVWRQETQVELRRGLLRAPSRLTLDESAGEWLSAAGAGVVRTRSGDVYKPSALRAYKQALVCHLLPTLGWRRLSAIGRNDVQDLVDRLVASGAAPSTVRNAVLPLRAIYRRALSREEVAVNPTRGLQLPAVRARRERVARREEARQLIGAVPIGDRALWATAMYAGLRRGELLALRWADIDLAEGLIRVERAWDRVVGVIEPKSRSGRRIVPLTLVLRRYLIAHRLAQPSAADGFVFGTGSGRPFNPKVVVGRAGRRGGRPG